MAVIRLAEPLAAEVSDTLPAGCWTSQVALFLCDDQF